MHWQNGEDFLCIHKEFLHALAHHRLGQPNVLMELGDTFH